MNEYNYEGVLPSTCAMSDIAYVLIYAAICLIGLFVTACFIVYVIRRPSIKEIKAILTKKGDENE